MTHQAHIRLDDDLAAAVKAYADKYRVSFSDAVRILITEALAARKEKS